MRNSLRIGGVTLELVYNPGDRQAEVPLARWWLASLTQAERTQVVEVGAVMPYWSGDSTRQGAPSTVDHDVLDPTDHYEKSIRLRAEQFDFTGRNTLSISTLEHIGFGDYGMPVERGAAIRAFEQIVTQSTKYFLSWPVGYNLELDQHAMATKYPRFMVRRTTLGSDPDMGTWEVMPVEDWTIPFGKPLPHGNADVYFTSCISKFLAV